MEFVIGGSGSPLVKITITDIGGGSFTFKLEQIGSGLGGAWVAGDLKGELRGLFFDVDGNVNLSSGNLTINSVDAGRGNPSTLPKAITTGGTGENDVTGFRGKFTDVNMNGAGLPADGGYDVGVAFGSSGIGSKGDDVQGITFTLTGTGLTLADFADMDFGVRLTSVGTVNASGNFIGARQGSSKILGTSDDGGPGDSFVEFAVLVDDEPVGGPLDEPLGSSVLISEENDADDAATFTISMSGGLSVGNIASVVLDLDNGTAGEGTDYEPAIETAIANAILLLSPSDGISYDAGSNTLTFDNTGGSALSSLSFTVEAINDIIPDNGETVVVSLSSPLIVAGTADISVGFDTATATIIDIDNEVTFSIAASPGSISEEDAASTTFTISTTGFALNTGNTASVDIAATASPDGDIDFTVSAVDDSDVEGTEDIVATLSNESIDEGTASITTALASVDITEIDNEVTFSIAASPGSISEEDAASTTFTISTTGFALNTGNTASVDIAATGTADGGIDYTDALLAALDAALPTGVTRSGATLTFTDAYLGGDIDFTVSAVDDSDVEGTEDIVATLSNESIDEGTASITTALASVDITEIDVAVTFGITVTSGVTSDDTSTQLAGISEESTTDNQGTFTITKGGGTLTGANTASVTLTIDGTSTAMDADFTTAVIAAVATAAGLAGIAVSAQDLDSLVLTWEAGDPTDFDVDLTAFNDILVENQEILTLTLSVPTVDEGSATLVGGQMAASLTIDEFEPRILDGAMITNSNVQNQFVTLTFQEDGSVLSGNPLHAAAKIYDLSLQGQQGSVIQDVGFNIDPAKHYQVTLEAASGTKAIVTDLTLEGVVIQGGGNAQLEINNTAAGADRTAFTAVIDPQTSPIVQAKTDSTDGTAAANTPTDSSTTTLNYLFGADGTDTLTGSAGSEVLNGGGGLDTLNGNGGNDILVFDNANNDSINGGTGFDLLRIDAGALALSQLGSSSDTNTLGPSDNVLVDVTGKAISNIEGILITEEAGTSTTDPGDPNDNVGTTVKLNAADVLAYSGAVDDSLYILGSPGDKVRLDPDGGWIDADGGTPGIQGTLQPMDSQGQAFVLYTATVGIETISLFVETDVDVFIL